MSVNYIKNPILSVILILNKNSKEIIIGLWNFDVIEGGILSYTYPNSKLTSEKGILSEKIKNLILITRDSNQFRNDWSLSPIKIESDHFYLYGFFTTKWHIISIQLPWDFSNWLIDSKSELILFESMIQNINFDYLPENQWTEVLLKPLYQEYADKFNIWNQNN